MDRACVRSAAASAVIVSPNAATLAANNETIRHWRMRRFPRLGSAFKIAAADEMLADGPRLCHSVASDFAGSPKRSARLCLERPAPHHLAIREFIRVTRSPAPYRRQFQRTAFVPGG
jgi:hypothetical protein